MRENIIKNFVKFIKYLIKDKNDINEKIVIGIISFIIMILIALVDIIMNFTNIKFEITEFIYNSFLIITLAALGVGSIDKYLNKKGDEDDTLK